MRHEFTVLVMWLIAIGGTLAMVTDPGIFTYLGPLYAVCMIGSVVAVRRARGLRAP